MPDGSPINEGGSAGTGRRSAVAGRVLGLVVPVGALAGLFVAAGTAAWWPGWAYIGLCAASTVAQRAYVSRRHPDLPGRRKRVGKGTPTWDKAWNALFLLLMLAMLVTAALDARGLPGSGMGIGWWPLGLVLLAASMGLGTWAMVNNPFFEGSVRIQEELGHRVVDTGPYACVRHPGYVGLIALAAATPFLLLSWFAFVPAGLATAWLVLRTALEDRFLRDRLTGYPEYMRRTRYRLVPGVW